MQPWRGISSSPVYLSMKMNSRQFEGKMLTEFFRHRHDLKLLATASTISRLGKLACIGSVAELLSENPLCVAQRVNRLCEIGWLSATNVYLRGFPHSVAHQVQLTQFGAHSLGQALAAFQRYKRLYLNNGEKTHSRTPHFVSTNRLPKSHKTQLLRDLRVGV